MKLRLFLFALCQFALLIVECECKGGRGGGSFGRSSSSRGSSSGGGWFSSSRPSSSSYSRPSPSYSSPSYSRPSPSPSSNSPSYGWSSPAVKAPSSNSPSYGWNINSNPVKPSGVTNTNTNSKPIGWNVQPSAPVGPPPAYPGLANRPITSGNNPPAYSPSYNNPPAYNPSYSSPSHNSYPSYSNPSYNSRPSYSSQPAYSPSYNSRPSYSSQPAYSPSYNRPSTYNTYSSYPSSYGSYNNYGTYSSHPNAYGSQFGRSGLSGNTYISNNYYGNTRSSGGSGFLTNALFYGAGTHHGYMWGSHNSHSRRRSWSEDEDRRWRATTKAPYFENKVPGSESYLPAAAVVGAATAFGLVSLLPLNVPENKPLMYCNSTDIVQTQIRLDGNIYSCLNQTIAISCPRSLENATIIDECLSLNKTMECDLKEDIENPKIDKENIFCTNATLVSRVSVVCNSTTLINGTNINETTTILNCYEGILSEKIASFIPTTTTEAPVTTTTEKQYSWGARVHIFFMKLIGKGDVVEKVLATTTTTTPEPTEDPRLLLKENETSWIPEALTIPPEPTTTTTTEQPFQWMIKSSRKVNGTTVDSYLALPDSYKALYEAMPDTIPDYAVKVPITTTSNPENSTVSEEVETSTIANENSTLLPLEKIEDVTSSSTLKTIEE